MHTHKKYGLHDGGYDAAGSLTPILTEPINGSLNKNVIWY